MATRAVPILRVTDAAASAEWYRRLGFEPIFEHRFAPELPAYVGIRRDDAEIHLSEHTGDAPPGSVLYLWVDAVDPLAAAVGVAVEEQPWGREIEVRDPDDNRLRIAEPTAGG